MDTNSDVQEATCSTSNPPSVPPSVSLESLEDEYVVEKILDRRFSIQGQIFYLIKWQGFADQTQPIRASELDRPVPISNAAKRKAILERDSETLGRIGFDRGLHPQKIIGATDCGGELCFLMKWRGSLVADIVTAREANLKCPQVVIKYYESKIKWLFERPVEEEEEEEEEEHIETSSDEEEMEVKDQHKDGKDGEQKDVLVKGNEEKQEDVLVNGNGGAPKENRIKDLQTDDVETIINGEIAEEEAPMSGQAVSHEMEKI